MQSSILSDHVNTDQAFTDLAAEWDVPTVTGLQHQGDVSVVPAGMVGDYQAPTIKVPRAGVAVVRGESGGNIHRLLADGDVLFDARTASATDLTLGSLHVPDGATAWLDHPEHGNTGIAPGDYVLRRKREQAEELRMVAD